MNLLNHPDLLDRLAAAYALGTLRGGARRRFEAIARQSPTARAAALIWQERFASMTELQADQAPSPNVWKRIENLLPMQSPGPVPAAVAGGESPMLAGLRRALGLWRGATVLAALAGCAAVVVGVNLSREMGTRESQLAQARRQETQLAQQNAQLAARLQAAPEIQYVAVLADDKASASMLVTFDPKHNSLTLKRVGSFQEAADKSLQLWALPPSGGPKSLGVLGADPVVKLTAVEGEVREVPALAISLEPKGGVPPGSGPTGPVLFKGALIQTTL
jgi:anti-sigma-K factor RskA